MTKKRSEDLVIKSWKQSNNGWGVGVGPRKILLKKGLEVRYFTVTISVCYTDKYMVSGNVPVFRNSIPSKKSCGEGVSWLKMGAPSLQ